MARYKRKFIAKEPVFGWDFYNKLKKEKASSGVADRQFVYLIKSSNGLFKIGISTNPRSRLSSIISSSGMDAELIAFYKTEDRAREVESKLHKLFAAYRRKGEWFEFPETYSLEKFETLCERFGMTPQKFTITDKRIFYDYELKEKIEILEKRETWLEWTQKINKEWEESKKKNE